MRGVYRTEFEPLVLPREHIGVYYLGKLEFYKVLYLEALYPLRTDFGSISAEKNTGKVDLKDKKFEPKLVNELVELVVNPIDDVAIEIYNPAELALHTFAGFGATRIQRAISEHHRSDRYTAIGVRGPLWQITANRKARVKRLTLTNEATADAWVFLCKEDGTRLSASYKVLAGQTFILDEDDLDAEFVDDLYVNITQQPINCDIRVVEKVLEDYRQLCMLYLMKGKMPSVVVHNPTKYDTPSSIVEFSGYRYLLEKVIEEPAKWTFVPLGGFGGK